MDQLCEVCGLVVWRMQAALAAERERQAGTLAEIEKDEAGGKMKATALKKRKMQYEEALTSALEAVIPLLEKNATIIQSACRSNVVLGSHAEARATGLAIASSAFRPKQEWDGWSAGCKKLVAKVARNFLSDKQDDLMAAVLKGGGAALTCQKLIPRCLASRSTLLLGPKYKDGESSLVALEMLAADVGYVPGGAQRKAAALEAARMADYAELDRIDEAQRLTREWDKYEAQYRHLYGEDWLPPKEERDDYEAVMMAAYGDRWIPRWPQDDGVEKDEV